MNVSSENFRIFRERRPWKQTKELEKKFAPSLVAVDFECSDRKL